MAHVSGKATRILLELLERRGIDRRPVVEGLPIDPVVLVDPRARVAWEIFIELLDRVERIVGGPQGLEELGAEMVWVPQYAFMRRIAAHVVDLRRLHEAGARWFAPQLFPGLRFEIVDVPGGRFVIHGSVPSHLRGSLPFFQICRGCISAISCLLDQPRSIVDAELTPRQMRLVVHPPPSIPLRRRLGRKLRAVVAGQALVDDLMRQHWEVTESYRALLRSRQDFRDVLERAPTGVAISRERIHVWVNPAFARLLGYEEPRLLVGTPVASIVAPEDRAAVVARLQDPTAPHEPRTIHLLRKDGTPIAFELAPVQEIEFEGVPAQLMVGSDVTDRKKIQDRLLLTDRMAALGTLAAGVAHEINNPLAYAYLGLSIAARALDRPDGREDLRSAIASATEGIERVRAIVADLKTFSRSDEETAGPVDVNEVLEATLRLAGRELEGRIDVVRAQGADQPAHANRARLGQVFLNLVLNAIEAIPEGERGLIRIVTRTRGGRVEVEIADNGTGIAPGDLERIFDPFFTTKPVGKGTGLGLAISHRIVTRLGGEISVTSRTVVPDDDPERPPLRTFVRVSIPIMRNEIECLAKSVEPPERPERRLRVLVVEDEPAIGKALEHLLRGAHDPVVATSGRAAIDLLRCDDAFDVILCDLAMPDPDGIAVYEAASPQVASRFVFLTGGAFTERARAFLESVPNRRLEKPFDPADVLAAIAAVGSAFSPSRSS
jgi:PAS domain S-box-containing protein